MNPETDPHEIPENFIQIIHDFTKDLSTTFPEYAPLWRTWQNPEITEEEIVYLFKYMVSFYPERFFDIIYQNEDIFKDIEINTFFLPNVEFKMLYHCTDVTESIRQSIWKYLQLILFSIIGSVKNKDTFGDTMNIFEGIDENDLHEKLKLTMESLGDFFSKENNPFEENDHESTANPGDNEENPHESKDKPEQEYQEGDIPSFFSENMDNMEENIHNIGEEAEKIFKNMKNIPGMGKAFKNMDFENMRKNMPKPEELHSHLKALFDGKIGKLAKEMADELANDLTDLIDTENADVSSPKDVLKQLMKNPKKMIELVKNIGSKLNNKMKSGEISQDEIMKEASEIFGKMKGMGGGNKDFEDMFKNIAKNMGGLGKNAKMNTGALTNVMKTHSMKERMREKMEKKRQMMSAINAAVAAQSQSQPQSQPYEIPIGTQFTVVPPSVNGATLDQKDPNHFVFRMENEEVQEKSVRPNSSSVKSHKQDLEEIEKLALEIQGTESSANKNTHGPSKKSKKGKK